jgi:hypothetical protein
MVLQKNKKTRSRYTLTKRRNNKITCKGYKSHTKVLKARTLKKRQKGGGEVTSPEGFWNSLSNNAQKIINFELQNRRSLVDNLETIKSNPLLQKFRLYDFIFDNQNNKLLKVWDHGLNNPSSITAGLPGIHIYTIISNNEATLIGTFIRS